MKVPTALHEQGACVGYPDVDIFFSDNPRDISVAKSLCAGCAIADACHSYAVANERYGIWGNTTAPEREAVTDLRIITPEERREALDIQGAILRGMKVKDIAEKFSVCDRTVYRYKRKMREQGLLAA
jgi:hypothetical protein